MTYKLGICTTQSPYQTVGTHYWCSSLLGLLMYKSSFLCAGVQTDDIQSGIVVPSRNLLAVVVEGGERDCIAFGSTWDALGLWGAREWEREREQLHKGFCAAPMPFSLSLQQVQLPCARSHKTSNSSSSNTTWRRGGRPQGACYYLCVCVHIKVDSKVMFCFNFLDLSLYDVKYKCLPNIEIYIYILQVWFLIRNFLGFFLSIL